MGAVVRLQCSLMKRLIPWSIDGHPYDAQSNHGFQVTRKKALGKLYRDAAIGADRVNPSSHEAMKLVFDAGAPIERVLLRAPCKRGV